MNTRKTAVCTYLKFMVGARLQFPYVINDRKSQPKNKNTRVSRPNRVDVEFGMIKRVVNHAFQAYEFSKDPFLDSKRTVYRSK